MYRSTDQIISRIFVALSLLVLAYWLYSGVVWVWNWYVESGGYSSSWWPDIGHFLWDNLSIVIALYAVICLQASGLAEMKFNNNFLKAFGLALVLTPPLMMAVYGHRNNGE